MTPVTGEGSMPVSGSPPFPAPGYYYAYGQSHGDDSSSFARSDGSSSLKEVEYRSLQMIGD